MIKGSFSDNVIKQFKKNKLGVIGLYIILFLFFVAIFAPLLANNKPIFIYSFFKKKYEDSYTASKWIFKTLYYRLSKKGLKNRKTKIKNSIEALDENIKGMKEHITRNYRKRLVELKTLFVKELNTIKIPDNRININNALLNKKIQDLKKIQVVFEKEFTPEKVKYRKKLYFPAVAALSWGDIFFIVLFVLFCFYKKLDKLADYLQSKSIKFLNNNIVVKIGLFLIPALFLALLWGVFKDSSQDNFNYKNLINNTSQVSYYMMPLVPFGENENILEHSREAPSWLLDSSTLKKRKYWHWLGTDTNGRDVLCRMVYGARISMSVGFVAVSIYTLIGIILGSIAGYYRGWVDILISRIIEIMMTFPVFFLILIVLAMLKPSIINIMIVIGLTGWTGIARLIRGEYLKLVGQDFVLAAKALGAKGKRIIFKHILPNGIAPVLVAATFGIAGAILTESALSFLGFGVPQPTASWGDILNNGRNSIQQTWWLTIFPGFAIFITITAYNLVGEALRDAMDPRLKK